MHSPLDKERSLQRRTDLITDISIGLSDGIIVPFAIVSGLSKVVDSNQVIIITGIITIIAGSFLMGLGGYFTNKKRLSYFDRSQKAQEETEATLQTELEIQKKFYSNIGLSKDMQEKAIEEMIKDERVWHEFLKTYGLKQDRPGSKKAAGYAFIIGASYAIGGLIPLSAYFFTETPIAGFKITTIITLTCLFIFGFIKSKFTGAYSWIGGIQLMLIGALAGGVAFVIASLFQ